MHRVSRTVLKHSVVDLMRADYIVKELVTGRAAAIKSADLL